MLAIVEADKDRIS
jgi:signal transduction histidine kinase